MKYHNCQECFHAKIEWNGNDNKITCTKSCVEIFKQDDLECADFMKRQAKKLPAAQEILDSLKEHCHEHNNCSGCSYWNIHNHDLCVIQFTIDKLKSEMI